MFNDDIRAYTTKALESRGVELKLGEVVAKETPTAVTLESGETLPAHPLVWGAGLHSRPVAASW